MHPFWKPAWEAIKFKKSPIEKNTSELFLRGYFCSKIVWLFPINWTWKTIPNCFTKIRKKRSTCSLGKKQEFENYYNLKLIIQLLFELFSQLHTRTFPHTSKQISEATLRGDWSLELILLDKILADQGFDDIVRCD